MCFSASVSFTSSAFLAVNGAVSTYFAIRGNRNFLALSMMPFFFMIQQFSEGMIWIRSCFLTPTIWALIFLFFAFFLYPAYQAFSCYWITRNGERRKKIMWVGLGALILGSFLYASVLLTPDFGTNLCQLHIFYNVFFLGKYSIYDTDLSYFLTSLYVFFTVTPFFISDARYTTVAGLIILLSALICWFVYQTYFVSTWCFYAAIISILISCYVYLEWNKKRWKLRWQLKN